MAAQLQEAVAVWRVLAVEAPDAALVVAPLSPAERSLRTMAR